MIVDANTLWGGKSEYSELSSMLQKLVPVSGEIPHGKSKNKALERYRKAANVYYDLYNNGLFNRARGFSSIFGFSVSPYKLSPGEYQRSFYDRVEVVMVEIIKDAAIEQSARVSELRSKQANGDAVGKQIPRQ